MSLTKLLQSDDIEDMMLDYCLPGYPEFTLKEQLVTNTNIREYIDKVLDLTLGKGVKSQIESFKTGFQKIIPLYMFEAFTDVEIDMLISGQGNENWTVQGIFKLIELQESFKADHGYNTFSKTFIQICEMMSNFTLIERREFLSFCTGTPKLPIGGFKSLSPRLTIVRKVVPQPDHCLPSVMTCQHYLKVPEYSSADVLRERFKSAVTEGRGSFHLS
jgi:E3 ubiquitin-protein ligase TRIP12